MSSRRFDTGELMRYTVKRNEVSTVLYGKFAIVAGSTQVYTTKHCAEPFTER